MIANVVSRLSGPCPKALRHVTGQGCTDGAGTARRDAISSKINQACVTKLSVPLCTVAASYVSSARQRPLHAKRIQCLQHAQHSRQQMRRLR